MAKHRDSHQQGGFRTKKHLGQHFLIDPSIIDRIVNVIGIKKTDAIVEIGPGAGAITSPILERAKHVYAIEVDKEAVTLLKFKHCSCDHLTIIHENILKIDFSAISSVEKIRVVGNLPYNLSSPIIFHLLNQINMISDAHIMVQKEVAERVVSEPGSKAYGRLSLGVQLRCNAEKLFDIEPEAFQPPPKVQSSIVRLTPKPTNEIVVDAKKFEGVVKQAFMHRRKKLSSNFKGTLDKSAFETIGIDPSHRAETLSLEQYIALTKLIDA